VAQTSWNYSANPISGEHFERNKEFKSEEAINDISFEP
jgi:hypothetical protein